MSGTTRIIAYGLLLCGLFIVASPAAARIEPCPNGGSLGTCPAWVDENGDGKWQEDEDVIYFTDVGGNQITVNTDWGAGNIKFGNKLITLREATTPADPYDQAQWGTYCAQVAGKDTNGDANSFTLFEGGCPEPALAEPHFLGGMELVGDPGSGYGGLALYDAGEAKTLAAAELYLESDIICIDLGGDGTCDHISVPWAADTVRKIGMNDGDGQVWVPINQATRRMTFDFDLNADIPQSVVFAAKNAAEGIPTLTQWGALASLLGLAAAGWWLLRRRQVVA